MDISIIDHIFNHLDEQGCLPQDFQLPNPDDTEGIKFAAGAMDGICIYHMAQNTLEDADKSRLKEVLVRAGEGNIAEAEEWFAEFCKEHRAITIIDEIQQCIFYNKDDMDENGVYNFAANMFLHSSDTECVKVAMSILELFETYDEPKLVKAIRAIGLCDEFTIFSVFIMREWPTAEKDILECARHVRGWGRIHCLNYIKPEEDETKEWILYNGTDNDVMAAYSSWDTFIKADVPALLRRGNLKYEEMHAILKITDALLDEGPVSGISNMDNPKTYLGDVLSRVKEGYDLVEEDRRIIAEIRDSIEQMP